MQGHVLAAAALLALAAASYAGAAGAAVAGTGAAVSSTAIDEVSSAFIPGALLSLFSRPIASASPTVPALQSSFADSAHAGHQECSATVRSGKERCPGSC